jgi:type II secretory pathway predicted ATPase ExeA
MPLTPFEAFLGLSGTPFSRDIPVKELLETPRSQELLGRLNYIARTRNFGVFTGDAGTGKTTALRKFSQELDINRYTVLYLSDSGLTPRNFYWETLHQLGYEPKFYRSDAKRQLQKALGELVENEKKTPVVIVDEAHLLSREMLEEIRFLLNLHMDSYSALSLILSGQSELRDTLKLKVNEAIWQRVDIRFHLTALNREETGAYIARHLSAVKAPGEIFTQAAMGVIHEYCGGIPRKVNKVATACLMATVGQNQKLVDDHLVRIVIESEFE